MTILDLNTISVAFGIIGMIVGAVMFFKKPQETSATAEAVTKALMEERKEEEEKKFAAMTDRIDSAFELAQNHTHTVDVKVDKLIETVNMMGNSLVELKTIINERIPKK